jgi:hypothetical protein
LREELTQERLKELLHYDPDTGVFTWQSTTTNRVKSGQVAGTLNDKGYIQIRVEGVIYPAHRLAFLYVDGEFPISEVDHQDRDGLNNRWRNLRQATSSENQKNKTAYSNNKSGYKGVSFDNTRGKFVAQIQSDKKHKMLGRFDCPREAAHAYNVAAIQLHGEFAVLNPI